MRVRTLAYLVLGIICGLLTPSRVFAQDDTGRITGRVLEAGEIPYGAGSHVTATSASDHRVTASVNRDGRFEFTGLEPGRYTLTAQPYESGEMLARTLTLSASSVATVNFAFPLELDPCTADVDYIGHPLAESFLGLAAVAHIRILNRMETEPHGGPCGRPLYHYAVAAIRTLQNPSFEGAIGRSIALSSKAELVPGDEYVAWLDASRQPGEFSFALFANEEEMRARVEEGSRVDWGWHDWVGHDISELPDHPAVSQLFAALTTFFGVGTPVPSTRALIQALASTDYATKAAMVRRFNNRRRGELDGRALAALSHELEQSDDVTHAYEYHALVLQVLMTQRDPRSIPALVPFVTSTSSVLSQFGGAAVPALVAGLATTDINGDGFFRISTLRAFEQMLTQPAIAATLSDENRAQIRAVAVDLMTKPVYYSGDREAGTFVLEAAAHLALVTGNPDLRHEVTALLDNDAAFEARHVDPMWIPLVSTHIRKALAEIPTSR